MTTHRETAGCIVLDTNGRFLIQERDDDPAILYAGKLALFGGRREDNESFLECAVREFKEELTYSPPAERFQHFMSYDGPDLDIANHTVRAELFVVRDVPLDQVKVTEGSLVVARLEELPRLKRRFASLALHILETFLSQHRPLVISN